MNHLVVYCHPNPKSFNQAILDNFVSQLKTKRHEVVVRDLYQQNFDPVLGAKELAGWQEGIFPEDVKTEHRHILWADVITFISPIWWGGFPSMLRGYIDRVFCHGFAFHYTPEAGSEGILKDKKAFTIHTLGESLEYYQTDGLYESMNDIFDKNIFQYCGLTVLGHKYFGSVRIVSDGERKSMLDEVRQIADGI